MKTKKTLTIILLIPGLLILVLAAIYLFWLGPTAKTIAQNIGSKALGTPLTIEKLSINPRNGTLDLRGFSVANPEAYARSNAVALASMQIDIDMGSIFTETVRVHTVRIDSPDLVYEQGEASDNVSDFLHQLSGQPDENTETPEPEQQEESEGSSKVVIVEHLEINDLQAYLANTRDPQLDIDFSIEQLMFSMTNGMFQLNNLTLSNPGRLSTPNLFELEEIQIQLDPDSLYSGAPVITDLQITAPHAFLERNTQTDTTAEFMKIAEGFTKKTASTADPDAPPVPAVEQADDTARAAPLTLDNMQIHDIRLELLDTVSTNAPEGLHTLAAIDEITLRLTDGTLSIDSVSMPNLPGNFATTNLFQLTGINVTLDPDSVFSDQVVIKEVLVDTPIVNLEQTETTGNVIELQKLAQSFTPPTADSPPAPKTDEPEPEPIPLAEMPVVVEQLIVTNLAVNMIFPVETNALANAFPMPSLGSLNPMGLLGGDGVDTNAVEEIKVDGQLTLVAFDGLTVRPLEGSLQLSNLEVGNPEGFANKNIVQLDSLRFGLDPDTLKSDVLLIREILVDNPTIAYERKLLIDNIKALGNFIEAATHPGGNEEPEKAAPENAAKEDGQKVVIEHLLVKSGMVKAKLSALPSAPIPLPKIEMRDIGKEKGGTTPVAAATEIGEEFYDKIIGAVSSTTGFAGDALKGVGALALPGSGEDKEASSTDPVVKEAPAPELEPAPEKKKRKRRVRFPGRRF